MKRTHTTIDSILPIIVSEWSNGFMLIILLLDITHNNYRFWFEFHSWQGVLDTTLCDKKVCQWLATGQWFTLGSPVPSTNKTDCHDITEILMNNPYID